MSMHVGVANPRTEQIIAALHEHAAGLLADTAAVDLLARHHTWLTRPTFTGISTSDAATQQANPWPTSVGALPWPR